MKREIASAMKLMAEDTARDFRASSRLVLELRGIIGDMEGDRFSREHQDIRAAIADAVAKFEQHHKIMTHLVMLCYREIEGFSCDALRLGPSSAWLDGNANWDRLHSDLALVIEHCSEHLKTSETVIA